MALGDIRKSMEMSGGFGGQQRVHGDICWQGMTSNGIGGHWTASKDIRWNWGGGTTLESLLEPQVAMGTSVSTEGRPSAHRVMGWHGRIVAGGDTGQHWVGGR